MAIIIIDNFQVDISNPIDNRFVVGSQSIVSGSNPIYPTPFYKYKEDIVYKYPGLRIWDFNVNIPYVWNGTTWIDENTTGALVENAATGNTGFENFVTKFKNNTTLLTKSLIFDNNTNVGIGLSGSSLDPNSSIGAPNFSGSTNIPTSSKKGLHVDGNIKTNNYFVGNIHADYIVTGTLRLPRIHAPVNTVTSYKPGETYLLKSFGDNRSWDLVSNILPTNARNLNTQTSGDTITRGNVYAKIVKTDLLSDYTFKPLISSGLKITDTGDDANEIRIESKQGLTSSTGIPIYEGLNTDNLHMFSNIISDSLDIKKTGGNVKIEIFQDVNAKAFYVSESYTGPELGTLSKPFKKIESALYAFVGKGTRWIPEYRYTGKIILLSYQNTDFNMDGFWDYKDSTGVYINRISKTGKPVTDLTEPLDNIKIATKGWLSVNNVTIDGQGNVLNYTPTVNDTKLPDDNPYWISTHKFITHYESSFTSTITNGFLNPTDPNQKLIDQTTKMLTVDVILKFKNLTIFSKVHTAVYHLNYGFGAYISQPLSGMSFINCTIVDDGFLTDRDNGKYILATNKYNGIETSFGNPIYLENRINPTSGLSTDTFIPTDEYLVKVEGKNWNNEGYFEMSDCSLNGSSSTIIYVKETTVAFTNIRFTKRADYITYGGAIAYDNLGKDYYNHLIDVSYETTYATQYSYSPYSNNINGSDGVSGSLKKALNWYNKFMPKKNLYYIKVEGGDGTVYSSGLTKGVFCRFTNINIENSFPTTPPRNNQRNRTPYNSGVNPQNWVNDADSVFTTPANSQQINYNKKPQAYGTQIGGMDAFFKIDGDVYFRVDGCYNYGESVNNILQKSKNSSVDFVDCDFSNTHCMDTPGKEWSSSDNLLKRGALKLISTIAGAGTNRAVGLVNSRINYVIFSQGIPRPTTGEFDYALSTGKGWNSDFIYPVSQESTVNKVGFSTTTPLVTVNNNETISNPDTELALNKYIGYERYKLIPGNRYYSTSGQLTVVKVPTNAVTITLPTEDTTIYPLQS